MKHGQLGNVSWILFLASFIEYGAEELVVFHYLGTYD